jgi:hypothetical protein
VTSNFSGGMLLLSFLYRGSVDRSEQIRHEPKKHPIRVSLCDCNKLRELVATSNQHVRVTLLSSHLHRLISKPPFSVPN